MSEQVVMTWFVSHPFTRNLVIAAIGGVSAMVAADWAMLKAHQVSDPTAGWSLRVAAKRYAVGIVTGVGPFLSAEVFKILGILGS